MQIRMIETRRGSANGRKVMQYHKGCIYDVGQTMAAAFIHSGWAEMVQWDAYENLVALSGALA